MTYTNKTQPTKVSPQKYLQENFKDNEKIRKEALVLIELFSKATGSPCVMWNKHFGFGKYYYKDSKGGEHNFYMTGFHIASHGFTLYLDWWNYESDIEKIGKYKLTGKSCLAIKSVEDIDLKISKSVIKKSVTNTKKKHRTEIEKW